MGCWWLLADGQLALDAEAVALVSGWGGSLSAGQPCPLSAWLGILLPGARGVAAALLEHAAEQQVEIVVDLPVNDESGHPCWLKLCAWPAQSGEAGTEEDSSTRPLLIGYFQDISREKADEVVGQLNEARWRLALEATKVGLVDVDLATDTVYVSHDLLTRLGRTDDVPVTFTDWLTLVAPGQHERVLAFFEAVRSTREPAHMEHTLIDATGRPRWYSCTARRIDSGIHDRRERLLALYVDVDAYQQRYHARDRLANQLDDLNARLLQGARDLQQEFSALLHDHYGQPLASLRWMADVLREQLARLPGAAPESLRLTEQISEKLGNLVAHMRSTLLTLNPPRIGVSDLGQALQDEIRALQSHVQPCLGLELPPEGLPSLSAHTTEQAFLILREALSNAIQHAEATCVDVQLAIRGSVLECRVCDNGQGISEAVFVEGRAGHFGLALMRHRARQIGAMLRYQPQPVGGCLHLDIPLGNPLDDDSWHGD